MGLCSTSKVITAVERSERPRRVIQGNHEWVTIIECISSKGVHIPPVVILKANEHRAAWYQEPNLPLNWRPSNSAKVWTTDKIGLKWLKEVFDPFSKLYSTSAKWLLILDGHSRYQTAKFDDFCQENAIIYHCMPPHTYHLLQPLDVGVFGPLKGAYGKLVGEMMVAGSNNR